MRRRQKNLLLMAVFLCGTAFFSCTSLQDVYVNLDEIEKSEDIQRIERALAVLDGDYLVNGTSPAFNTADFATNCVAVSADAEKALSVQGLQKSTQARLLSLQGRAQQLAGNTARAKNLYAQSAALSKGDVQGAILASRLGLVSERAAETTDSGEQALLVLEKAVQSFSAGRYADAAAGFDTAFIALPEYYRTAYSEAREKAWNLRTVSDGTASSVLLQNALTVSQMFMLTQEQASHLLYNYTAGKKYSEGELFRRLTAAGLLTPVSAAEDAKDAPKNRTLATRFLAARFLWNVQNRTKTPLQRARYSALFKATGASPIADVPLESPDFDAVLGCVENELLSLTDGIHFDGDATISALELHAGLEKIK